MNFKVMLSIYLVPLFLERWSLSTVFFPASHQSLSFINSMHQNMQIFYKILAAACFVQLVLASPAKNIANSAISPLDLLSNKRSLEPDSLGYIFPIDGLASTTIFDISTELLQGTACGMNALPSNKSIGSSAGTGPGYLYAAINQLAFGANPEAHPDAGPGPACGLCYELTPVSSSNEALIAQKTTFMIVDECPAKGNNTKHCGQCSATAINDYEKTFHFDIAADAMNNEQYQRFIANATDGTNWKKVHFNKVECAAKANAKPEVDPNWGCLENCKSKYDTPVCQDVQPEL